jgi:hypothetical protein
MRIAVCFSGQANRITGNTDFFKSQLSKYSGYSQCDLFFSHWEGEQDLDNFKSFLERELPNCMTGSYAIAGLEFTPHFNWSSRYSQSDCWSQGNRPEQMFKQAGGIKNVDQLRQRYEQTHNFKYDLVVRSRGDIDIKGNIDLPSCANLTNTVAFASNWMFRSWWDVDNFAGQEMRNDQWFASDSNTMSKITTLVDYMDEYTEAGARFHPETLLWWHVAKTVGADSKFMNFRNVLRGVDND